MSRICIFLFSIACFIRFGPTLGDGCRCVKISHCADGGGAIRPRNTTVKTTCAAGHRFCCVIIDEEPPPPQEYSCGIQKITYVPGFHKGEGKSWLANYGEFPWIVKILGSKGQFLGTGALIGPTRVLSVAHIFENSEPSSVLLGAWNDAVDVVPYSLVEIGVEKMIRHEHFNPINLHNDIAILRLEKSVDLNSENPQIGAVCLPSNVMEDKQRCLLSTFGDEGLPIVRRIELSTLLRQKCQDSLRETFLGRSFILDTSFICAFEKGKDACKGHGGSPLVCKNGDGNWSLAGLVAWGVTEEDCRDRGRYPGVYLNVYSYLDWLNSKNSH